VARGPLTLVKFGGELLESSHQVAAVAVQLRELLALGPCVVVHGGGKEIDAESARRGLVKRAVEGLRITDADTLEAVVAALAGSVNTRLVAGLVGAGIPAVGLTGADAGCVRVRRAAPHRTVDGREVDLGLVGEPLANAPSPLLGDLLERGYVPVIACLGIDAAGTVHNVNADTLAAHLAASLGATRLLIAGTTTGVLDGGGRTIETLTRAGIDAMVADGTASAGMVAKLAAVRAALGAGVAEVAIVDGRAASLLAAGGGTRLVH
jgi:acetylglutamate kinase